MEGIASRLQQLAKLKCPVPTTATVNTASGGTTTTISSQHNSFRAHASSRGSVSFTFAPQASAASDFSDTIVPHPSAASASEMSFAVPDIVSSQLSESEGVQGAPTNPTAEGVQEHLVLLVLDQAEDAMRLNNAGGLVHLVDYVSMDSLLWGAQNLQLHT